MRCRWTRTASTTSRDVPKFLAAARAEPEAVICGRPVFDASIPQVRFLSRYITHALVWLQTLSFSAVRDSMCGFRLYPLRTVLEVVDRDGVGTRMDFDMELLVKLVWRGRTLRWIDTRVSYPADGISHFRMLYDNLRLAGMHVPAGARHVVARALCWSGAACGAARGRDPPP